MAAGGSVVADQAATAEDQAVATAAREEPQASSGKQAPEEANATLEMYPGGTWNVLRLRPVMFFQRRPPNRLGPVLRHQLGARRVGRHRNHGGATHRL